MCVQFEIQMHYSNWILQHRHKKVFSGSVNSSRGGLHVSCLLRTACIPSSPKEVRLHSFSQLTQSRL